MEAVIVAIFSASAAIFMIYISDDCKPLGLDPNPNPVQVSFEK